MDVFCSLLPLRPIQRSELVCSTVDLSWLTNGSQNWRSLIWCYQQGRRKEIHSKHLTAIPCHTLNVPWFWYHWNHRKSVMFLGYEISAGKAVPRPWSTVDARHGDFRWIPSVSYSTFLLLMLQNCSKKTWWCTLRCWYADSFPLHEE